MSNQFSKKILVIKIETTGENFDEIDDISKRNVDLLD